jgi:hypothetical protein
MIDLQPFCLLGGHRKKSQCFQALFKNPNMFEAAIRPHANPSALVSNYGQLDAHGPLGCLFGPRIGVVWRTFNALVDLAPEHGISGRVSG